MARTQDQIAEEVTRQSHLGLPFNFAVDDLIAFLDFDHAKTFLLLKDNDADRNMWKTSQETRPPEQCAREYMEFAYDKAVSRRGLSAARSLQREGHMTKALLQVIEEGMVYTTTTGRCPLH